MNTESDRYRPIKGWAEILFRTAPLISETNLDKVPALNRLKQEEYTPVGSWLPTEEFIHTFDILEMFQGNVKDLYNIPRPVQAFDAINLCIIEPSCLRTLMVVPKKYIDWYKQFNTQMHAKSDLMLVTRPTPFQSFRYPSWPDTHVMDEDIIEEDDDDTPEWM